MMGFLLKEKRKIYYLIVKYRSFCFSRIQILAVACKKDNYAKITLSVKPGCCFMALAFVPFH